MIGRYRCACALFISFTLSYHTIFAEMSLASLGASGAKVALKSVSKSVTGAMASTSSTSDSTNDRSDDLREVAIDGLGSPVLSHALKETKLMLVFKGDFPEQDKLWVSEIMANQPYSKVLGTIQFIRTKNRLMERRKLDCLVLQNKCYLSERFFLNRDAELLKKNSAALLWEKLNFKQKQDWALVAGWGTHPFAPWLQKNKLVYKTSKKTNSLRQAFIKQLSLYQKNRKYESRHAFIAQLLGEKKIQKTNPEELQKNKVYFAFVNEKGFAGAAQGHCAVVVENKKGERVSFAYTADFDWDRPVKSGMGALVGINRRLLEIQPYQDFVEVYEEEGRYITLVELKLNHEQKNRMLFRLIECQYNEEGHYSFLRQNCANPLRDILNYTHLRNDEELIRWHTPKTLYHWALSKYGRT